MAAHSLVTMPVVIQSQNRKKCEATGCRSSARCAEWRWREMVTLAMVAWVNTSATTMACDQAAPVRPWARNWIRQSHRRGKAPESEENIDFLKERLKAFVSNRPGPRTKRAEGTAQF